MMVAILIIMVSMLAYLSAMMTAMRTSNTNEFRDISTRIANQTGEALLSLPFTDSELSSGAHSRTAQDTTQGSKGLPDTTQVVRGSLQTYAINWSVSPLSLDSLQIVITVTNVARNKTYNLAVYKQRTT
jgi:hypothetical protein